MRRTGTESDRQRNALSVKLRFLDVDLVDVSDVRHLDQFGVSRSLHDIGTELDTIRRMMRHSHIDTTVNHYLKADPRKMKSATTAVDDALDL